MTLEDAAEFLNVSESCVHGLINAGRLRMNGDQVDAGALEDVRKVLAKESLEARVLLAGLSLQFEMGYGG